MAEQYERQARSNGVSEPAPLVVDAASDSRQPAKLLLITSDPFVSGLAPALAAQGIECDVVSGASEIPGHMGHYPYWVAVFDAEGSPERALEIQRLLGSARHVPTLILAPPDDLKQYLIDPSRDSRDECAAKPIQADELVHRVTALMFRSGYRPTGTANHMGGGDPQARDHRGRLVVISHAKGGVGASTIAANAAVGLTRFYQARTLLVDADLWYGDLGLLMDMTPSKSLVDAVDAANGTEFDTWALARVPAIHQSGVSVLMRPQEPSAVEQMDPSLVASAVNAYTALFDFVIVDTPPSLGELSLQLLDMADQIVLVATSDVSALYNVRRFLDLAERLGYLPKIDLVVNRADTGVSASLVQQHLRLTASVLLPSAGRLVVDAANHGTPILLTNQDHPFARSLLQVVELIAGRPVPRDMPTSKQESLSWTSRVRHVLKSDRRHGDQA